MFSYSDFFYSSLHTQQCVTEFKIHFDDNEKVKAHGARYSVGDSSALDAHVIVSAYTSTQSWQGSNSKASRVGTARSQSKNPFSSESFIKWHDYNAYTRLMSTNCESPKT